MSKISDIIEAFILEQLEDTEFVNLSRNELASFFNCAPSQINYVLSTRFTMPRGFIVESHRGGGGYIRLARINLEKDEYINDLISNVLRNDIDYRESLQILDNLVKLNIISVDTAEAISYAISSKALAMPIKIENRLRSNILRNIIINIIRGR